MRIFILFFLISIFTYLQAVETLGTVLSFKGSVKVKAQSSIKKQRILKGLSIQPGDLFVSAKNSSVILKLLDGSLVVLDELSSIHFSSLYDAQQLKGQVLYKITSRDAKNSLKIKTPFAVIGIKGTTFIISATKKDASVKLQEGLIGIASLNADFELYRKKVQKEFDDYKARQDAAMQVQLNEFERYKNRQKKYSTMQKTKEFDLEAGNTISFNAQVAKERSFSKDDNAAFDYFTKLINEMN